MLTPVTFSLALLASSCHNFPLAKNDPVVSLVTHEYNSLANGDNSYDDIAPATPRNG